MRCRHCAASWLFAMIALVFARFCGSADGAAGAMFTGGDENALRRGRRRDEQEKTAWVARRCGHCAAAWLFATIALVFARFCGSADGAAGAMFTGGDKNAVRRRW